MATKGSEQDRDKKPEAAADRPERKSAEQAEGARRPERAEYQRADDQDEGFEHERGRRRRQAAPRESGIGEVGGLVVAAAAAGAAAAIKSELLPGILIGAGAYLVGRILLRSGGAVAGAVGGAVRPVIKVAVRAGYAVTEGVRETVAETGEQFRDIMAEVEAERAVPRSRRPARTEVAGGAM